MSQTQNSRAIILRARVYADSDKIVTFLSSEQGKLTGIAKGARNSKRRFPNCLDPFTVVRVHYKVRPSTSLVFMESCDLLRPAGSLADPVKLAYGSYLLELVDFLTVEAQPIGAVYELLNEALEELRSGAATGGFLRSFELQLLHHTGFHPDLDGCARCQRSFASQQNVYLEAARGRLVCSDCREPGLDLLPLHTSTLESLQRLRSAGLGEARSHALDEATAAEAAEVMGHLLALHLPRPLRSVRLITSLSETR
jgi:DNA repair protein RecO (recombination protein O)